ncbi:hypothetical protein BG000_009883 [Podila horticola]|nr:hypothetical protein BG000_009883 [Podila horticola]
MATNIRNPTFAHPNGARLLCLDGGGVRGIASLIILNEIMKGVQKRKGLEAIPRPADYFELAAGTSAGGINAIMLFRLHMTTEQAKEKYENISKEVFRTTVFGWRVPTWIEGIVSNIKLIYPGNRFSTAALENVIDRVVEEYGLDDTDKANRGEALLYHPRASKMMERALLRSYVKTTVLPLTELNSIVQMNQNNISIKLAVKATSAAPTYFREVKWHPEGAQEDFIFWDGGLLNNNPITQLWYDRHDVVAPNASGPPISCVISLGTGHKKPDSSPTLWFRLIGIASTVMSFATSTNAKDKEFESHMYDLNGRPKYKNTKYIRFDPPLQHDIGLADYSKMGDLIQATNYYLQSAEGQRKLQMAVDAICPNDHLQNEEGQGKPQTAVDAICSDRRDSVLDT